MKNLLKADGERTEPVITKDELRNSFTKILTNLYFVKQQLKGYLPLLLSKATFKPLKLQIREIIININADLLRLDFIFKVLNIDPATLNSTIRDSINLESQVTRNLKDLNLTETDMSILYHILIVETISSSSFKLLFKQAILLGNKEIYNWVHEILKESVATKKKINELLKAYFEQ
jgi:ferritin-like metal-binding protein YciE